MLGDDEQFKEACITSVCISALLFRNSLFYPSFSHVAFRSVNK